ncbi:DotI/IcmL/TraM family protein [Kozakia baliensis]|uniref:Type IV secretion protein DotI n=1 Tax=Kozakia baliensis TaxID=153496 RepID=A0A1D8UXV1_9PROT|nr:DotI/IcmL/TraM family protein [Kozakia baliensis]AOX18426.1 type IV secretion protein DotI [Kozakia baliensis]
MKLRSSATIRRMTDPEFQGVIVERSLLVCIVQSVLLAIFVLHDAVVWIHPPQPKYFWIDGQNAPRPAMPLDSPIVGQDQLLSWAIRWAIAPYNINYRDYPIQLNVAGQHYLISGWNTFAKSFIDQGNLAKIKQAKLLCFAQPTRAATVRDQKIVNGHMRYVVQFPFIQTCENVNQQNTQTLMATAVIDRVEELDHPDGLAISQLVVGPARS